MQNIVLFDEYTARILAELYEAFPVKTRLDARRLTGHSEYDEYGRVLNERGEPSRQYEIASATIEWLWESGYIRGPGFEQGGMSRAVLSPMGLAVLKAVPDSIKVQETTGERLARLVKEGAHEGAGELARSAIAAGIRFTAKAVSE